MMKSTLSFPQPPVQRPRRGLQVWWQILRRLVVESAAIHVRRRLIISMSLAALVCASMGLVFPAEEAWLKFITPVHASLSESAKLTSLAISDYGGFLGFNLTLWLALYTSAALRHSDRFRVLMVCSMLGALATGSVVNTIRPLVGRSRPNSELKPGFYGPQIRAKYHSFPSGHAATAYGASAPLLVALPELGVPIIIVASVVAGSRLLNLAHHPSDVLFSLALALAFGIPLGLAARRVIRQDTEGGSTPSTRPSRPVNKVPVGLQ